MPSRPPPAYSNKCPPSPFPQVAGYTLALYGLNMYHAYRGLKGGVVQFYSLALHAATDNSMKVMLLGMLALLFVAQPG